MRVMIWQLDTREVPGIGLLNKGQEFEANDNVAKNLERFGQAKPKPAKAKKAKTEE